MFQQQRQCRHEAEEIAEEGDLEGVQGVRCEADGDGHEAEEDGAAEHEERGSGVGGGWGGHVFFPFFLRGEGLHLRATGSRSTERLRVSAKAGARSEVPEGRMRA